MEQRKQIYPGKIWSNEYVNEDERQVLDVCFQEARLSLLLKKNKVEDFLGVPKHTLSQNTIAATQVDHNVTAWWIEETGKK